MDVERETGRKEAAARRKAPRKPVMIELPRRDDDPAHERDPLATCQQITRADLLTEQADPRILYRARLFTNPAKSHVVEIGSDEDWWILDAQFGAWEREQMEIWAEDQLDGDMACRIYPTEDNPHAAALLSMALRRGHPEGVEVFERPDGIKLVLRTCDTNMPMLREVAEHVADLIAEQEDPPAPDFPEVPAQVPARPEFKPGVEGPVTHEAVDDDAKM